MSQSLRIALVADHFLPRLGGIEMQVSELARQLAAAGQDVTVVTTTPGEATFDGLPIWRLGNGKRQLFGHPASLQPLLNWKASLRTADFDVVHIHCSVVSPLAYATILWCQRWKIPHVATVHSSWRRTARVFRVLNGLFGFSAGSTCWTAVSRYVTNRVQQAGFANAEVLPNGIHVADWQVEACNSDDPRVITVLRLHPEKRPQDLLRAIPTIDRLLTTTTPPRYTFVGDGPSRGSLSRLARRMKVADRVEFPGRLNGEQIRDLFGRSQVFVMPRRDEAFGIALLEARAAGLPAVAMQGCGAAEQITNGVDGLVAGTQQDLAEAVATLLSSASMRRQMSVAAQEAAREFDWSHVVPRHLEVYEQTRQRVRGVRSNQPISQAGCATNSPRLVAFSKSREPSTGSG